MKAIDPLTEFNHKFVKVRLSHGYCGEIDPNVVGDACVFHALDIDRKSSGYIIYDSASVENSDLASSEGKFLNEGDNCYLGEIFQNRYLIENHGPFAYLSKILKKISCK